MEDLHKTWPHRWLNVKARVSNSKIDRLGVEAIEDISKGEDVGVLGGIIIPKKDIEEYWKIVGHVSIQIDDNFFIVPTSREELKEKGLFNHSCSPNCGFSSSINLVAIKDIKEGEELTIDYAFCESFMEDFKCNCGSENCRGTIRGVDWKISKLQEKFKDYFSPYILRKIGNKDLKISSSSRSAESGTHELF